jgi:hypothetical protein
VVDPYVEKHFDLTPYNYVMNNPIGYIDPFGLDTVNANSVGREQWRNFNTNKDVMALGEVVVTASSSNNSGSSQPDSRLWNFFSGSEKHFNGSMGLVGTAVSGYNKIPNEVKRHYAYKLSKQTGIKSGKIFQGLKGTTKWAGKVVTRLGPIGITATLGVIGYEVGTDTWDAHTVVNGALLVGAGAATIFAAPAVLTGVAAYGVADYFFDIGGKIDNTVGRKAEIWDTP